MENKFGLIYKITNNVNGKIYIGQTFRSLESRWQAHKTRRGSQNHAISLALRKYGPENFFIESICSSLNPNFLNDLEKCFIEKLQSVAPLGYNLTLGGQGSRKFSPELSKKLSLLRTGKPSAKKGKKYGKNNYPAKRKSISRSAEIYAKIAEKNKGKTRSLETRIKMKQAGLGRQKSTETILKMSLAQKARQQRAREVLQQEI